MFAVVLFTVGILLILSKLGSGRALGVGAVLAGGGRRERPWPIPALAALRVFLSPCRQEVQVQFQPEAQVSEGSISLGEMLSARPQLFPGSFPKLAGWLRSLSIPFGCWCPKPRDALLHSSWVAKQLCAPPGHLPRRAPCSGASHPGDGGRSHPRSLCTSSCRAPGDEEAQAENLITSNGKVTCAAPHVLCRCFCLAPACLRSLQLRAGAATALLFPLQRREHRKRRTEQEPCGESRGCRTPAQASVSGGTRAVAASVLGRKGGRAGAVHGGDCRGPSRAVCWDGAALRPPHSAGASACRGHGREACSAGEVPGVPCLASPGQPSRKRKHLSGFSLALRFPSLCSSTPKRFYF